MPSNQPTTPEAQAGDLRQKKREDENQAQASEISNVQIAPKWANKAEQFFGSQKPKKHQIGKRADQYVGGKMGEGAGAVAGTALGGPAGAAAGKTIGKIAGQTLGAKNIAKGAIKAPKIVGKGIKAACSAPKNVSSRVTPWGRFARSQQKRQDKNFIKQAEANVPGVAELMQKAKKIYKKLIRGVNPVVMICSLVVAGVLDSSDFFYDLFSTALAGIPYILLPLKWMLNGCIVWVFKKVVIPRLGLRKVKDFQGFISKPLALAVKSAQFIFSIIGVAMIIAAIFKSIPWVSSIPWWTILVSLIIFFSSLVSFPARLEYRKFKKKQIAKPLKEKIMKLVQQHERQQAMMQAQQEAMALQAQ